ncbi:MAG TPA: efflux RND transporter periplasmic adaptor subunit [Kofleriaceae bacterium]|nr:efflux RND transporter periplasmic adaptor subunit [Kofleriaceae bacterium]
MKPVPIVVVAVLAAGGFFGYRAWHDQPTPTTYTTTAAARGTVVQSVTASGTLSPVVRSTVGSQVSGRITEILVDYNDHVKAGQILARLDKQLLAGQVAQARARLASARAELVRAQATAENARISYERTAALLESGAVSTAEVEAAKAAHLSAKASIQTAKSSIVEATAAVENATTNLAYTTITSPIDGVVISRSVDAGQTVAASLQAPELFVIAGDLSKMELHAAVAEADVGQLKDGMRVDLAFDAFPERTFAGAVRQVRNQATTTSNVVTYDAVVAVENTDGALRPGMTATATFIVAEAKDSLVVPQKALRYRPADAKPPARDRERPARDTTASANPGRSRQWNGERRSGAVWVLREGKPVRVRVEPGLSDGTTTAITSDELKEGDLVITTDSKQGAAGAATPQNGARNGSGNRGNTGGRRGPPALF